MAESNDLSLLSGTGPKRRSDQSQKGDEKWTHRGNDDDLTNGAKTCIFNPDGVFGIHRRQGFWSPVTEGCDFGASACAHLSPKIQQSSALVAVRVFGARSRQAGHPVSGLFFKPANQ
jgi:hypothetical protein